MEHNVILTIDQKLGKDLKYIEHDLIAQQPNGNYCKFSRLLGALTCINMSKKDYVGYWERQYDKYPIEQKQILQACETKLSEGLTSVEDMIEIINISKDYESEKKKAIKLLLQSKEEVEKEKARVAEKLKEKKLLEAKKLAKLEAEKKKHKRGRIPLSERVVITKELKVV